jgi:hypothetical protein
MKRNKKQSESEPKNPERKDQFLTELDDAKLDEAGGGWTPCQCGGPIGGCVASYGGGGGCSSCGGCGGGGGFW